MPAGTSRPSTAQAEAKNVSRILYPDDTTPQGKELRFKQQYFFVSASLQDMLAQHLAEGRSFDSLHEALAIQLNDTHPALAIPELMRLLVDEHELEWEQAWNITRRVFSYTNHTLLPEALEAWPVAFFERLLPRHLQIIYLINRAFLDEVTARWPGDNERRSRMSLIDEGGGRQVRMANLAVVGEPHGQRRGQAALRADDEDDLRRLRRAVSGPLHQRHERHRRAALAQAVEPAGCRRCITRAPRARVGERPRGTRAHPRHGGGRRVPARVPRDQAGQQAASRRRGAASRRHRPGRALAVRRAGQAHPRVQAAAAQPAVRRDALPQAAGEPRRRSPCRAR